MNINACIYNNEHVLCGCITDSVIEHFYQEFNDIKDKNFIGVDGIIDIMFQMLIRSEENYTADFLNCLKLISVKHRYECSNDEFIQAVSRAYHNLVRYCCSTSVYQQVFNETIKIFRQNGLQYIGKGIQRVDVDECAFSYEGIVSGVKIALNKDLYNLWKKNDIKFQATVYAQDKKYIIINSQYDDLMTLINSIKGCINDFKEEKENDDIDLKELSKQIIEIAQKIKRYV